MGSWSIGGASLGTKLDSPSQARAENRLGVTLPISEFEAVQIFDTKNPRPLPAL